MTKKYLSRSLLTVICAFAIMNVFAGASHAQVVATWTGGGDGVNYSDPANWSTGVVPINGATNYNVVVPNGRNIVFDVAGSISGISYGTGGSITVANGVAFNVNSVASLNSNIIADGAGTSFTANGLGVALGQSVQSIATNGGQISTAATSYTGQTGGRISSPSITAFRAQGNGSAVNASSLNTISNTSPTGTTIFNQNIHFIAEDGGVLDFSNLQTVFGGGFAQTGPQNNVFTARTGGVLRLDSLQDVYNNNVFNIEVENFSFPSLSTAQGATFNVASGTSVFAPSLTSALSTNFNLANGSLFHAPSLTNISGSTILLRPSIELVTGQLTNVNNSRITVLEGASISLAATSYQSSTSATFTAFRADGAGSIIDASSLIAISNASPTGVTTTASNKHFIAENGGVLNFSNLETLSGGGFAQTGPQNNVFTIRNGGEIMLNNLQSIVNNNIFNLDTSSFALPSLTTAHGATFNLSVGTTIQTPILSVINSSSITMPIFSTWNAGNLNEIVNSNLNMEVGASFNAPNLSSFQNSSVTLSPGIGFNTAQLTDVSNSRIAMTGGGQLVLGVSDYLNSRNANDTAFRADGINSRISAPNMTSISKSSGGTTSFIAENRGTLNFSSVDTIIGGPSTNNAFIARTGGRIELGEGNVTRRNSFSIDGAGSAIAFNGLNINTISTTVSATNLGTLELSGDLSHVHTTEANFNFDNGRIVFKDTPLASLEIAGENKGTATNGLGNFGFQQLTVGSLSSATTLVLSDNVNNGNRINGNSEVQYLLDVSGNGLVLNNGSRIILNGHDLFVSNGQNSFFSVRDLFAIGQTAIAYDSGVIALTAAAGEILNGSFEFGSEVIPYSGPGFNFAGPGQARFPYVPRTGDPENRALELTAGSPVTASQYVSLLDDPFYIQFEAWSQDQSGRLSLLLDDVVMQEWDWSELGTSDFQWMSFLVDDQALLGGIDINLALRWDADTGDQVLIDNLRMVAVPEPSSVLVLAALSVTVLRHCRRRTAAKH